MGEGEQPLTLTVGCTDEGDRLAVISTGGHPQRIGSGECLILTVEKVNGWGRKKIDDWYARMSDERPWETRQ